MLIEFRAKSQITLPMKIVREIGISEGDKLDVVFHNGTVYMRPVVLAPRKNGKKRSLSQRKTLLQELYGSVDDSTLLPPDEIPWDYDTPFEEIK